jgi:hypothetical protein
MTPARLHRVRTKREWPLSAAPLSVVKAFPFQTPFSDSEERRFIAVGGDRPDGIHFFGCEITRF